MADLRSPTNWCVAAALLLVSGCGKPEDARGYMPGASAPASAVAEVKTPPPPVPAAVAPFMGRTLKEVSKGTGTCKGVLDIVTRRHTGAKPGAEIAGWGWDERAAKPLDKVLFIDAGGKVVGGATTGDPRPDVPKALPEVKTPQVGWHGVADVATDKVQAVGVTAAGETCAIGETDLG